MITATIALWWMILHLAIAEFRPEPMRLTVFLKNRQKQSAGAPFWNMKKSEHRGF
jgi:hypothetical protein